MYVSDLLPAISRLASQQRDLTVLIDSVHSSIDWYPVGPAHVAVRQTAAESREILRRDIERTTDELVQALEAALRLARRRGEDQRPKGSAGEEVEAICCTGDSARGGV